MEEKRRKREGGGLGFNPAVPAREVLVSHAAKGAVTGQESCGRGGASPTCLSLPAHLRYSGTPPVGFQLEVKARMSCRGGGKRVGGVRRRGRAVCDEGGDGCQAGMGRRLAVREGLWLAGGLLRGEQPLRALPGSSAHAQARRRAP